MPERRWDGICHVATARGVAAHLLPRPSPLLAPLTRPAMSTNSTVVGTVAAELLSWLSTAKRSSGTATTPTLGSMVQKGKFAAWALPFSHSALNRVDCAHRQR